MKIFYLDNFRGFQNTKIPVLDVNFCVGENSTGKTSFLSVFNLMSSYRFWLEQSFDTGEPGFGNFDDIVSISSKDKSYFRIGFAEETQESLDLGSDDKQTADKVTRGILLTYMNNGGMPKLHKCTLNYGRDIVTVTFTEKTVRYKNFTSDEYLSIEEFQTTLFDDWAAIHNVNISSGYKVVTDKSINVDLMPTLYILSHIYEVEIASGHNKKGRQLHYLPGTSYIGNVAWIAPIRTKPRRTYDEIRLDFSPEGEHTPYIVKKILDSGKKAKKFQSFMKKFGEQSGLFKEVNVHRFGKSVTSPFELEVVLETKPLNISSVGYGVSQGLPVIVELFVRPQGTWYAIQQPEVHLHPRAQAAIGEVIYELAATEEKKFFIETHSDFTIDRYRISVRENGENHKGQVLFFERKDGENIVKQIQITEAGELEENMPMSYREFFLKEGMRVIGI